MKLQSLLLGILLEMILLGTVLLGFATALSAQNTLPNPHDDSCWSSLSALHACQLQAYDQAQEQAQEHAQNCSSYPEFQCNDYYQPKAKAPKAAAKPSSKQHQTTATPTATAVPPVTPDDVQTSGAN
jgi:hypothetical protein